MAVQWWERHVVPRLVDASCGMAEIRPWRDRACEGLSGRVLEVGFGSGLNVEHYPDGISEVRAVEPSDVGWERSAARRERSRVPIRRSGLDGQRLSEEDESVDAVLCTFTLCTIPDPVAALAEFGRVLAPGGTVHFAEHGLSPEPRVARWQRRLDPVERAVAGGCNLSRDPVALLQAAGFEVGQVERDYLPGPGLMKPWGYLSAGSARRT